MEGASQTLTVDEIIAINRAMIDVGGGEYMGEANLLSPGSLSEVVDEIQGSLFGIELHPGLIAKVSTLTWRIIKGHVFHDGNKRTGLAVAALMLEKNGAVLRFDLGAVDIVVRVASGEIDKKGWEEWLAANTELPKSE